MAEELKLYAQSMPLKSTEILITWHAWQSRNDTLLKLTWGHLADNYLWPNRSFSSLSSDILPSHNWDCTERCCTYSTFGTWPRKEGHICTSSRPSGQQAKSWLFRQSSPRLSRVQHDAYARSWLRLHLPATTTFVFLVLIICPQQRNVVSVIVTAALKFQHHITQQGSIISLVQDVSAKPLHLGSWRITMLNKGGCLPHSRVTWCQVTLLRMTADWWVCRSRMNVQAFGVPPRWYLLGHCLSTEPKALIESRMQMRRRI